MRRGVIDRQTTETEIRVALTLEGRGRYTITTGIRFLDHMLELFARHGAFDLEIDAKGDLDVDQHHTVEDLGIALGEAVSKALGDRRGINRAGYFVMPMDETLAVVALDLGGRPHAAVDLKVKSSVSATCSRSWCTISSKASRSAPAPTSTRKCCMAGRATITSRRSSKRSLARCAWRARRTSSWRKRCPGRKD